MTGRATTSELDAALREGGRVKYGVTIMFVVIVVLLGAGFAYYRYEQAHACSVARKVRQHDEQLNRDIFTRLGERMNAPQSEIDGFLDEVAVAYDTMPTPAAC